MKKVVSILLLVLHASLCAAQFLVQSPDENLKVTLHSQRGKKAFSKFRVPKKMTMKVFNERRVLTDKEIGLTVKSQGHRYAFGKAEILHADKVKDVLDHPRTRDAQLADLEGRYNSITLSTDKGITLEVRVYNNGVAYRFKVSGYPEDYKILEVCDVFPGESPVAILGTFEGEYISPWHTFKVEESFNIDGMAETTTKTSSPTLRRGTRIVPWRDALSTVSIGISHDWYTNDTWGDISETNSFRADFTYKYIYGGISATSCQEIQHIYYGEGFWPFEGMIGGINTWGMGIKGGFCLPVQNCYDVWNFIPYVGASMLHLHQHGKTRLGYKSLDKHNHYMVGPGIKVQFSQREGFTIGAAYEFLFFTDKKAPTGMNSVMITVGKMF